MHTVLFSYNSGIFANETGDRKPNKIAKNAVLGSCNNEMHDKFMD